MYFLIYYKDLDEGDENLSGYILSYKTLTDTAPDRYEFAVTAKTSDINMTTISTADNIIGLQLARTGSSDTYDDSIFLMGVKVFWTSNALNDD